MVASFLPPITRVGVVGLGRMGLPMARHLAAAGFDVSGFDRHPERGIALAQVGGQSLASASAVAGRVDALLLMVTDDKEVREAAMGSKGMLAAARPGSVLIISSTVKPSTCREVAAEAALRGLQVLDAPVARGQRAAEDGTLTVYVGGATDAFQRCRPVFEAFGKEIFHIGEDVGAGQVAKLVNNLILRACVLAVYEGLTLAAQLGVPPGPLRPALEQGSADSYALRELHRINLTWQHKDLAQAMEVAAEASIPLPLTNRVRELTQELTVEALRRLIAHG